VTYAFHPDAEKKLLEVFDYYESFEPGFGISLAIEVHSAIEQILAHPLVWPVLEGEVRRCLTSRFPCGVLYSIAGQQVLILAVMNLHRHPDYWKGRAGGATK